MTLLSLVALSLVLALAGCSPATTDPAKAAADKAGVARSQPPVPNPVPPVRERESVEGGGGY
jgi:hypothetical protein